MISLWMVIAEVGRLEHVRAFCLVMDRGSWHLHGAISVFGRVPRLALADKKCLLWVAATRLRPHMFDHEIAMRFQLVLTRPLMIALIVGRGLSDLHGRLRLHDYFAQEFILRATCILENEHCISRCQVLRDDQVANGASVMVTEPLF